MLITIMTMTMRKDRTMTEVELIRAAFQRNYVEMLEARLKQDDLESVGDGWIIDGNLLGSIDQQAASLVRQSFRGDSALEQALEQPDCYEGIDYQSIIQRKL